MGSFANSFSANVTNLNEPLVAYKLTIRAVYHKTFKVAIKLTIAVSFKGFS